MTYFFSYTLVTLYCVKLSDHYCTEKTKSQLSFLTFILFLGQRFAAGGHVSLLPLAPLVVVFGGGDGGAVVLVMLVVLFPRHPEDDSVHHSETESGNFVRNF